MKMSKNMSNVDRKSNAFVLFVLFFQLILITCSKKKIQAHQIDEVKALNSTYFCVVNKTKGKPKK